MLNKIELEQKAQEIRRRTFEMVMTAGGGHLGGSFSSLESLITLYYGGFLSHRPQEPEWPKRDRLIFSKGHANNALNVVLADRGFYPESELNHFLKKGSFLGNHVDAVVPGIEVTTGSLGHGLGLACGLALGARLAGEDYHVFVIIGDGESQEGSIWEAAMFANQHNLDNLTVILDRNRLGSEDPTENTAGLDPIEDKWIAFGWDVKSVDGHSFPALTEALEGTKERKNGKPLIIVANTVKGKGISVLENLPKSHHTLPSGDEIEQVRRDLA